MRAAPASAAVLLAVALAALLPEAISSKSSNIHKVYIVFSNHFDAGYTENVNGSTTGAVISTCASLHPRGHTSG